MKNVREIIKSIRNVWNVNLSPPVVGNASGIYDDKKEEIQAPKYDPYRLIDRTPHKLFKNKRYYEIVVHVVRKHCQLKSTRDPALITDLIKQKFKYQHILDVEIIKDELRFCVKNSPKEFQLAWSSILDVDINLWYGVRHSEYVYRTHEDKSDPQKRPELTEIPYFKYGITQYIQLLSFLNLKFCDHPAIICPFTSCISLASYFDSIFVYVLFFFIFKYLSNCDVYLLLFSFIFKYIFNCDLCFLSSRLHQDTDHAVFAHPKQKSFSGQSINEKSGIPKGKKQYKLRNCFFKWFYIHAILASMFMITITNSGGAINERIHANLNKKWSWLPSQLIGYDRAPAMDQLLTHSINYDAAKRIVEDVEVNKCKYSKFEIDQNDEILSIYDSSTGIDQIRKEKLNPKTKHGNLSWDVPKCLKKYWKSLAFILLDFIRFYLNLFHIK